MDGRRENHVSTENERVDRRKENLKGIIEKAAIKKDITIKT